LSENRAKNLEKPVKQKVNVVRLVVGNNIRLDQVLQSDGNALTEKFHGRSIFEQILND
jgi:hypothetical protein